MKSNIATTTRHNFNIKQPYWKMNEYEIQDILKLCLVVAILNFIFIHFPIWWSYKNCVLKWWQSWILFLFIIPYGGLILKLCLVVVAILDFIFNHYPIWWSYIKIVSFGGGNIGFWICTKNEIYYFTYIFLYS
jgi:hypothetical protein